MAGALQKDLKSHMHTIAHEVGHLIVGPGHPDEPEETNRGLAALIGTDHSHRLMVSGKQESRRDKLGLQLVKTEWDAAIINITQIGDDRPD